MVLLAFFQKLRRTKDERYRKAALTGAMNAASHAVSLITALASVPLTLNYIGVERFGIWMALSMAFAVLSFSDLGLGIGMQDHLTRAVATQNLRKGRQAFLTSLAVSLAVGGFILLISLTLVPQLPLTAWLNLKTPSAIAEIHSTAQSAMLVVAVGIVSGIIHRAFAALQEGFWIAGIQMAGRIASLLFLIVAVQVRAGLPTIVLVVGAVTGIAIITVGLPLLIYRHKWLLPAESILHEVNFACLRAMLPIGILGLGASAAMYLVTSSTSVLIATKHGASSVTDYAILLKLLSIPTTFFTYLVLPLWPAITDAQARRDHLWVDNLHRKFRQTVWIAGGACALFFTPLSRPIIELWAGNSSVAPAWMLLIPSIFFMIISLWNTALTLILNGLSRYKSQATMGLSVALLAATIALLIPAEWGKHWILWVVNAGFAIRCFYLSRELDAALAHQSVP